MQTALIRRQNIIAGGGLSQAPGTSPAPATDQQFDTPPNCRSIGVGVNGNLFAAPVWTYIEDFGFLPATTATAGNALYLKSVGTGTEVIARAAKGGVNIKTQATTPATNDNVLLTAIASSGQIVPITAVSQPKFKTLINLTQISTGATSYMFASAGMHQTTSVIVPNTASNDEVVFLYDPTGAYNTLAAATRVNWILCQNINGTVTYIDSGVAVAAAIDYHLVISFDNLRVPHFYINGTEYGSGSFAAATSAALLIPCIGEQILATSPAGQNDMDVRFVSVERFAG